MTTSTMQPLGARVLIQRATMAKTKGGILLPDTAKEKPLQGTVVAVGPGSWDEEGRRVPVKVAVGDRVLFRNYAGNEVHSEGQEEYLILSEDDLLAVIA